MKYSLRGTLRNLWRQDNRILKVAGHAQLTYEEWQQTETFTKHKAELFK